MAGEAALRAGRGGARRFIWSRARAPSRRQYASRLESCGRRHRHRHCHRRREVSLSPAPAAVTLTPLASAPLPSPSPAGKRPGAALGAGWKVGDPYPGFRVPGVTRGRRLGTPAPKHLLAGGGSSSRLATVAAGAPAGLSLRICAMGRPLCAAPREPGAASPRSSLLRGLRGRAPTSSGDGPESGAASPGPRPRAETVQPRGHQKTEDGVEHRTPPTPGRPGAAHLRGARDRPASGRGEVRNRNCAPSGRGALLLPTLSAGATRGEGARLACVNRGPPGAAALEGPPDAFYPVTKRAPAASPARPQPALGVGVGCPGLVTSWV